MVYSFVVMVVVVVWWLIPVPFVRYYTVCIYTSNTALENTEDRGYYTLSSFAVAISKIYPIFLLH